MKRLVLFTLSLFLFSGIIAQTSLKPADLVEEVKQSNQAFTNSQPFSSSANKQDYANTIGDDLSEYDILDINASQLNALKTQAPANLQLEVPMNGGIMQLELVKVDLFSYDFGVYSSSSPDQEHKVDHGIHYRGMLKGNQQSIAAISIVGDEIMGLISSVEGNLVIGKLDDAGNTHIIYDDFDVITNLGLECGTTDDGIGYKEKDIHFEQEKAPGDCVRLYMEIDYDIFQDKGSVAATTNFVTGLMNQVITIYANENIPSVVTQIFVWDAPSPYSSNSSSGMLSDFQSVVNNRSRINNSDLGQLLSYQASGGIAAGFSGICASQVDESLSFSSINSTYSNFPTYSWSVMVVAHEFGHTWGSRHTHACVWNGNNTAIDGCSGSTEGSCSLPGFPSQGGTIMSYCHVQSVGINFNEGFGPQPGNVIRASVDNASCTSPCGPPTCTDGIQNGNETGVDCGGPDCPACPTCSDGTQNGDEEGVDCGGSSCPACPCNGSAVTLTIVLDNYPEETTWEIRNAGNAVVASGGAYGSQPDGSTVVENICLTSNACYDFIISDSYGDGICCGFGNGSYSLTDDSNGSTLASGGNFGTSETTNFCVGGGGGDTEAPSNPTNLTASNTTTTTTDLNWNASTDNVGVTGYNVYINGTNIGNVTGTAANITGLSPSTTYSMYVTAFDAAGNESGQSNTVSVTTLSEGDSQAPTAPTNLTASNTTTTTTDLAWNASSDNVGVTGYNVYVNGTNIGNVTSTGANITGLSPSTTYAMYVTAIDAAGNESGQSNTVSVTTLGDGGGNCTTIASDDFESGWGTWNDGGSDCRRNANDQPYANNGTFCARLRDNTSTSVMTTDDLDLSTFSEITVDFSYYPRSMDNSNEDFWLQVSTNGGGSYTTVATWARNTDFDNDTRYNESVTLTGTFSTNSRLRFRCDASGNQDWVYIDDVVVTSGCSGLIEGGNGRIQIAGEDAIETITYNGTSLPSTGLANSAQEQLAKMKLFPNPVNDRLVVNFTTVAPGEVTILVSDLNGRILQSRNWDADTGRQQQELSVIHLERGIYLVQIITENARMTQRFVVTR